MFAIEYTIFAGLIGSTFITMGTHGTDQDMVQRMLTAPDMRRSRRSVIMSGLADIPIAFTFLSIGVVALGLLPGASRSRLCRKRRTKPSATSFSIRDAGRHSRTCFIAGIFATAMGSLSTALNALATSFTRDWYEPYINPASTSEQSLRAVRWATVWFSVLMIVVASITSYLVIVHPNVRIIPIVLGIFGYTYGSLLSVSFSAGMFTKTPRQRLRQHHRDDHRLHRCRDLERLAEQASPVSSARKLYTQPSWLPVMEFPWWICFGTIVTFALRFCSGPRASIIQPLAG